MALADPTIPGLNPPNPAVIARLLLTLLVLPVAGLARTWDLRSYTGTMLAVVTGRQRAYSQRYTERFLARLAYAGAAEHLTEVMAKWTWSLWHAAQTGSDQPTDPAVFYVDGHRKAVYSDMLVPRGPVGKLGGKILGCRELVVLHDADGHPRLSTTHRGDHHLTRGLPQMLHCYEQATGQALMQRVVVDRDQMAAEFLAQLKLEGRQVVTLLRSDQYEAEGSFEQVGPWQPWRYNRSGQVICEVAAARFALKRPDDALPPLEVEVALIRDWRKLLVVEQADEAGDVQDWRAACAACSHHAKTDPGDYDGPRYGRGRTGSDLFPTLEVPRKQHSRLADSAQSGHESRLRQRAGRQLGTGQTPTRDDEQTTPSGTPGTGVPCTVSFP